jgi:Zn finger protein HypA/HybF involved in hydrogenase expression
VLSVRKEWKNIMKIWRKDKRMRCLNCYHEFWVDAKVPKKMSWCYRCNSLNIEVVKEYGKPVIESREYEI